MDINQVKEFFDSMASGWDEINHRNEDAISEILLKSGIEKGSRVLDVACGTGVLFPDYKKLGAEIVGIDISENMVKAAREKFPDVKVVCGDAAVYRDEKSFDAVMIYNAFPHFADPEALLSNLASLLTVGGRLSVAHGLSEKELAECHSGSAKNISVPLMKKEALAALLEPDFEVDVLISDERMYMVSGKKIR